MIFNIVFFIVFVLIVCLFIYNIVKMIIEWHTNKNSPKESKPARVAAKRFSTSTNMQPVAGDASGAHGYTTSTFKNCYVTFQFDNGEKIEFNVKNKEYNMLNEGDTGIIRYQGTKYLGFERAV